MKFEDFTPIYWQQDDGAWVAEIEEIPGCFALMDTREQAAEELKLVFAMIAEEEAEKSHG
jgi:predicted RNase H-like HicB family nuclease